MGLHGSTLHFFWTQKANSKKLLNISNNIPNNMEMRKLFLLKFKMAATGRFLIICGRKNSLI